MKFLEAQYPQYHLLDQEMNDLLVVGDHLKVHRHPVKHSPKRCTQNGISNSVSRACSFSYSHLTCFFFLLALLALLSSMCLMLEVGLATRFGMP